MMEEETKMGIKVAIAGMMVAGTALVMMPDSGVDRAFAEPLEDEPGWSCDVDGNGYCSKADRAVGAMWDAGLPGAMELHVVALCLGRAQGLSYGELYNRVAKEWPNADMANVTQGVNAAMNIYCFNVA